MLSASKGKLGQIGHLKIFFNLNITRPQESTVKDVEKLDQKWKSFIDTLRKDIDNHNCWYIL